MLTSNESYYSKAGANRSDQLAHTRSSQNEHIHVHSLQKCHISGYLYQHNDTQDYKGMPKMNNKCFIFSTMSFY